MNEAFVAMRNVAKTNKQDTTTAKSLNLVQVEKKMEQLRVGKLSILIGGTEPAPAPQVTLGTGRSSTCP